MGTETKTNGGRGLVLDRNIFRERMKKKCQTEITCVFIKLHLVCLPLLPALPPPPSVFPETRPTNPLPPPQPTQREDDKEDLYDDPHPLNESK